MSTPARPNVGQAITDLVGQPIADLRALARGLREGEIGPAAPTVADLLEAVANAREALERGVPIVGHLLGVGWYASKLEGALVAQIIEPTGELGLRLERLLVLLTEAPRVRVRALARLLRSRAVHLNNKIVADPFTSGSDLHDVETAEHTGLLLDALADLSALRAVGGKVGA